MVIYCEDCDEEISEKRIEANPKTTVCVQCQQERESKGKYSKHTMVIDQEIKGWEMQGFKHTIVRSNDS